MSEIIEAVGEEPGKRKRAPVKRKAAPDKPKGEVVKHEAPPPPARTGDPLVDLLREAVIRPDVDVGKLRELREMMNAEQDRRARHAFDLAFTAMQPKLPVIDRKGCIEVREKDSRGQRTGALTQSTAYAKLEDIVEAVQPILGEHGLGISFRTGLTDDGRVRVVTILVGHGHREQTEFVLPHDSTGSKNAVQAIGSSTSYGKRMGLCAILNIVTRGDDDDGFSSGAPLVAGEALSAEQLDAVRELAEAAECPVEKLLDHLNKVRPQGHPEAGSLSALPASRHEEIIAALKSYEANRREREARKGQQR